MALNWSAAPLFTAGGAYFGKWALYWTAGPIFDGGGAYFGPVLVAWVSGQKEGFTVHGVDVWAGGWLGEMTHAKFHFLDLWFLYWQLAGQPVTRQFISKGTEYFSLYSIYLLNKRFVHPLL